MSADEVPGVAKSPSQRPSSCSPLPPAPAEGSTYACSFTQDLAAGTPGDTVEDTVTATGVDDEGDPAENSDNAIVQYFKRNHNLLIGQRTAERIKCEVGSAVELDPELEVSVKGRDLVSGIPKVRTISSEDVRVACQFAVRTVPRRRYSAVPLIAPSASVPVYCDAVRWPFRSRGTSNEMIPSSYFTFSIVVREP